MLQSSELVIKFFLMSVFTQIQRKKKEELERELFILFLCKTCKDEHHQFSSANSFTPKFQERRLNENGVVEQQLGEKRL